MTPGSSLTGGSDGEGASEIIRSPSTGMTRRTTIGKRWIVICQQDEAAPCDMLTFETREQAERLNNRLFHRFRPDVHYVEQAEVVTPTEGDQS